MRRRTAIAGLLTALLGACALPQIHQHQLSYLDKGLSESEAISRLSLQPLSRHEATIGSRSFVIQRYRLNNGLQLDPYFLSFEANRLVFWGYINEYRRHPDRDLNAALNTALQQMQAAR